jgi:hypothetical protein
MLLLGKKLYGFQFGLRLFKPTLMFQLELLDKLLELILRSTNLLLDQIRTVLQVDTDVTHGFSPSNSRAVHSAVRLTAPLSIRRRSTLPPGTPFVRPKANLDFMLIEDSLANILILAQ